MCTTAPEAPPVLVPKPLLQAAYSRLKTPRRRSSRAIPPRSQKLARFPAHFTLRVATGPGHHSPGCGCDPDDAAAELGLQPAMLSSARSVGEGFVGRSTGSV